MLNAGMASSWPAVPGRRDRAAAPIETPSETGPTVEPAAAVCVLPVSGNVPPELRNRLGNRFLPKLRRGQNLKLGVDFAMEISTTDAARLQAELRQALSDLNLLGTVQIHSRMNHRGDAVQKTNAGSYFILRPSSFRFRPQSVEPQSVSHKIANHQSLIPDPLCRA